MQMYLFCYRSFGPRQFSITQKTTWCFPTRSLHPYVVGIPEMLQGNNYSLLDTMAPFALSHIHQRRPRFLHVQMIFGRAFGSSVPCQDKLIKLYFVSLQLLSKLFLNWIVQVDFRPTHAFWHFFSELAMLLDIANVNERFQQNWNKNCEIIVCIISTKGAL